jgi:hypothetical protein
MNGNNQKVMGSVIIIFNLICAVSGEWIIFRCVDISLEQLLIIALSILLYVCVLVQELVSLGIDDCVFSVN